MTAVAKGVYGLMAEFGAADELLQAASAAYDAGYREMDAYSPFPVQGLAEVMGYRPRLRLQWIVIAGLFVGAAGAFGIQYYASVIAYPINVGGRPLNSWPLFIPVSFELAILVAAIAAVVGMLVLNRLPTPYHPVFNVSRFQLASRDRFFLLIKEADPQFDVATTRRFLRSLGPLEVREVEP